MTSDTWPRAVTPVESAVGMAASAAAGIWSPVLRPVLVRSLDRMFRDGETARTGDPASGDEGWMGPDSVAWRVHSDTSMFVGGITALAFQALHPRVMAGVADHSDFRHDPLGRLRRTAQFVGATCFGTSTEAAGACATVRRVHEQVHGTTPDGRPYEASDPELVDWVHCTEFAAFVAAHRLYGERPVRRRDLDRYAHEVARIGVELGDVDAPTDWTQLTSHLSRHRTQCVVGEQARAAMSFLEEPPLPGIVHRIYPVLFRGAIAALPEWARVLWGISAVSTAEISACRALVRGLGAALGPSPSLAAARARAEAARAA
ncbi:MAG TPA: oxygenase MpaB family protein [Acidimicrobiales bacterium]|nr:oxygenase MpaB family protein [Acidimicrobiales bacterium]